MARRAAAGTKPKRDFMGGYKTYDTSKGFGSADEWIRAAEALGAQPGFVPPAGPAPAKPGQPHPDLVTLGLDALPESEALLKSAMRRALIPAHPDHGGSREAMEAVTNAWHRLQHRLARRAG